MALEFIGPICVKYEVLRRLSDSVRADKEISVTDGIQLPNTNYNKYKEILRDTLRHPQ